MQISRYVRPGLIVVLVVMLAVTLAGFHGPDLAVGRAQDAGAFSFALIGDLGYNARQDVLFQAVLDDLNATPDLAFVVHDGDLWGGGGCADERYQGRLAQFQASVYPFIFTPGDND